MYKRLLKNVKIFDQTLILSNYRFIMTKVLLTTTVEYLAKDCLQLNMYSSESIGRSQIAHAFNKTLYSRLCYILIVRYNCLPSQLREILGLTTREGRTTKPDFCVIESWQVLNCLLYYILVFSLPFPGRSAEGLLQELNINL